MNQLTHIEILEIMELEFQKIDLPPQVKLQLPPPCFTEMEGIYVDYVKNKSFTVSFPVLSKQTNPMGVMQGGFISAAFDNVFGPLSYLIAKKPVVTLDLCTNYIRPAHLGDSITITCRLVGKGFSTMHLSGEAKNQKNKPIATATANCAILSLPM